MRQNNTVDYVELPASDFDAVEQFYSKVFGWTFTEYGEGYRAFHDGKREGGFYRSDLKSTTANGAALIVLYSDQLETLRQNVIDAGGEIAVDIFEFPGGRRFQFLDPHGNELAIWSDADIRATQK